MATSVCFRLGVFVTFLLPAVGLAQPTITSGPNYGTWSVGEIQTQLIATGGNGTYSWSVISGSLPPGISIRTDIPSYFDPRASAGLIGVATTPPSSPYTYNFTLQVTSNGQSTSLPSSITITSLTVKDEYTLPDAFIDTSYSYSLTALNNQGPVTWSLNNGSIPPGMNFSQDGVLSGAPTAAGTYNWNVELTDGVSTAFRGMQLNVYAVQITTPGQLPNAKENVPYSAKVSATGPSGCCTFSVPNNNLPYGLTLDPSTGIISGTAPYPAIWNFTITAAAGEVSYTKQMSLEIVSVPATLPAIAIYGANNHWDDCSIGVSCSRQVFANNSGVAPFSWTASGLPPGMSIRWRSGVTSSYVAPSAAEIWGTPTALGNYSLQVTITDFTGATATNTFPLKVSNLFIDGNDSLPGGTIGVPYSKKLRVIGGNDSYTVRQIAGQLPDGLTFSASSFLVSGTPIENGGFDTAFEFADTAGDSLQNTFYYGISDGSSTLTINNGNNLGTALLDSFYNDQLSACCASAYVWTFVSGTLPPGIALSPSGDLSGTPTSTGTYTFLVLVADASNATNTGYRFFSLTVTPIYLIQNNGLPYGTLPYGNVGTSYNQTVSAGGGDGTITWALQPFNYLPPGLTLSSSGIISGLPSQPGLFNFAANAMDASGNSLTVYFSLSIYPAGVTAPLSLPNFGPNLGTIVLGGLTFQLQAEGGTPPYTYSLSPNATVIPGMRVVNRTVPTYFPAAATGGYIGVIAAPGTYSSSIRVTDSLGKTFDQPITLTVSSLNILFGDGNLPKAELNTPYSYMFTPYGGSGNYAWSASGLPPGISINSATGQLSGTATAASTYYPQITLEDIANSTSITQGFTLIVDPFAIMTDGVLPQGTVNTSYNQQLSAPNCGSGCTWTFANGSSLPGGLSLNASGLISGSPNYSTIQWFSVQASGSNGTVQKVFSIQVIANPAQSLYITTTSPIVCCTASLGAPIGFTVLATGGSPPYTWSVISGSLPPGMSLQPNGETLSSDFGPGQTYLYGKPLQAGTYSFTLQVKDTAGKTYTAPFTWNISPLWLEYPNLPNPGTPLIYNTPYTQPMLVMGGSGNYTSWSALTPMPPGLSINSTTGIIGGTPTNTGYFSTEIQVKDDQGNSSAQYINFNVAGPTSTLVNFGAGPNLGTWQPGYTATINLNPNGGTAPYTITALSALPPGFSLETGDSLLANGSSSGAYELVGQPLAQGTFTFTLEATDSAGNIGVRTFTITIAPFTLYTNTNLPEGSVGAPYSEQLVTWDSSSSVSWSITAGSAFPPGLGVSSVGVISGTPTTAGTYSVRLNGTDASGVVISYTFNIQISNISLTNAQTLPQGTEGIAYSYQLNATGNVAKLTWSATGLPGGLSISTSGLISGTPGYTGTNWVTITATDGTIPVSVLTPLYINAPNPTELDYSGTMLPDATVGSNYSYDLFPDGGVPPYTWSVAPGFTLPSGLYLISGTQLPSYVLPTITQLAGAPTTVGMYTFNLIATDSKGNQVVRTFTLKVSPLNVLWGNGLPNATVNTSYSKQFTAVGGTPPYTFSASTTALDADILPAGMSLSSAGLLSGAPTSTGNYPFYLTLRDSAGNSYKTYQSLTVTNSSGLYVTSGNPEDGPLGLATGVHLSTNGSSTYNWTVSSGNLPPGFSIITLGPNESFVYGPPSAAGTYVFTLRAADSANLSNFADHTFTFRATPIDEIIPRIASFGFHALPTGQTGQPYFFTYRISGGTPPYSFVESPFIPLPTGLTLNSNTGVLSGTPTQIGTYSVQPIITDSAGNVFDGPSSNLVITPTGVPPPLTSNPSFGGEDISVGVPLRENYLALDQYIQTGTPPYTWSVSPGSNLPPGMAILPGSNGVSSYLGGVPTTPGNYNFNLMATDASGQSIEISFPTSVSPLALSPGVLPTGSVGTPYSVALAPSGGTPPYTIQALSYGDMPAGLSLSPTGVLSGTPTSAGYFNVGVTVLDNSGLSLTEWFCLTIDNSAGQSPAITLSPDPIHITYAQGSPNPGPIPVSVSSTTGTLAYEISVAGVPGASLSAAGGTTPSSVNLNLNTSGLLPGVYTGLVAADAALSANRGDATPVILTVTGAVACSYTLSPTSGNATITGGEGSFAVNTNAGCAWTATVDNSWISLAAGGSIGSLTPTTSGSGPGTVTYFVAGNSTGAQRTGSITVAGQTYTITQFGPGCSFGLSPATLPVGPGGATAAISVIASGSTCTWSASGLGSTPTSGTGSSIVNVKIPANTNSTGQTLTATIAGQTLTVNQAGASCAVNLGASTASFGSAGGTGSVGVNVPASCGYSSIPGPSWISLNSGSAGTGPGTLTYGVSANSTTASRIGSFTVGGQLFTIVQQGLACSVTLDTSGLGIPYSSSGGAGTIVVTTNGPSCSWTASSTSTWATVLPTSGTGSGTVGVSASANTSSTTSRTTTLTVGGQTVNLTQGGTVCTYGLQSASGSVPAGGAPGSVGVIAPSDCSWSASTNTPSWLSLTSSGTGGTSDVQYVAQPNTSSSPRTGSLTIAGLTYTVNQAPASCTYSLNFSTTNVAATGVTAMLGFTTGSSGCSVTAMSFVSWISVSTAFSGTSGTVTYTVAANSSGGSRVGTVQIGDQTFTITQIAAACGFGLNSAGAIYYQGGTGGASSALLGSWAEQGCPAPAYSTDEPSAITLSPPTGPAGDIYTLNYGVAPYTSVTLIPRYSNIIFGGQLFMVKQYPFPQ